MAYSLLASVSFAICNITIGQVSSLGFAGLYDYNTGALLFTGGYFVKKHIKNRRKAVNGQTGDLS